MPSEPIEAEFAYPPVLTQAQEEEYRQLEKEGPLSGRTTPTVAGGSPNSLSEVEQARKHEGYIIVQFDKGAGEDPREWSHGRKWVVTLGTAFLCLAVALGSSIITGDMTGPAKELGIKQIVANLTVTCFVIGFGVGPLFLSPLSEIFGRRPIYIVSVFLYFIFTLPSALARNAATLIIARQIAGIAASAPICNMGGSIADVWAVEERGIPMAVFSAMLFVGPCLGPVVGSWIGERAGWRWIYWVLFIFCGLCFAVTCLLPETLAPILLRKKAEELRKKTGNDKYRTLEELERLPFTQMLKIALFRPLKMLFTEPIVLFMSFYLSFVYGLLYLLFFAFPIAFEEIRGFSGGLTGTTFVSIMIGIFFAGLVLPKQERIYAEATKHGHYPEARLFPMMIGAFIMPMGLFIFAFTGAYPWVHWIAPCIAGAIFGFSMILLYVSANSYIIDSYSDFGASAMAAKTFMRSEIGAVVPLYVNPMFHNMGFQYAGLLLALIGCLIAPMPFVFYKWGEKIRLGSKMASKGVRRGPDALDEKAC
ncbi:MFS polyamine transporter [Macrolepiota fuliginosa MF-IS2]|uniref:MFS polyamine transporter n=1 Tax=Macrolepiota fuliginosa MF-IS2 TaxID=1400762 RepID=A0A9P6C154_9AGAR|nr:MFS polyamine transporter [Macrolepiota fuliginosa MF-IS2]